MMQRLYLLITALIARDWDHQESSLTLRLMYWLYIVVLEDKCKASTD